jgi:hypothetical protein
MIMKKDIKDSSWLEQGYRVVIKIAHDIEKLEQRAGELTALLKNRESVVHDIQKGLYVLNCIARSMDCDGIDNNLLPAEYPTNYEIFVKSILKRLTVQIDSTTTISLLFQKKGSDWFSVWERIPDKNQKDISTICDALLLNYQKLLEKLRTETEATRKEHLLVQNEIDNKIQRIKKYQYYATKAFKEDSRKRRTEAVDNTEVSQEQKKQKTYGYVQRLIMNDYTKRLKAKFEGIMEEDFVPWDGSSHLINCIRSIVPSQEDEDVQRVATVVNVVNGISKSSSYYFETEKDIPIIATTPG